MEMRHNMSQTMRNNEGCPKIQVNSTKCLDQDTRHP